MKILSTRLTLFIGLLFAIFTNIYAKAYYGERDRSVKNVSFIELIANPEKYEKSRIAVMGYLFVEHDKSLLFWDERGYKNYDEASSIDLPVAHQAKHLSLLKLNFKNVEVIGIFLYDDDKNIRYLDDIEYINIRPD